MDAIAVDYPAKAAGLREIARIFRASARWCCHFPTRYFQVQELAAGAKTRADRPCGLACRHAVAHRLEDGLSRPPEPFKPGR